MRITIATFLCLLVAVSCKPGPKPRPGEPAAAEPKTVTEAGVDLATKAPYEALVARMNAIMDQIEAILARHRKPLGTKDDRRHVHGRGGSSGPSSGSSPAW